MSTDRREFLRISAATGAALGLALGVRSPLAAEKEGTPSTGHLAGGIGAG